MTTAYLTILLYISDTNGNSSEEKSQKFSYRCVIDGSRSAQRTAVAEGLVFEFITVCNRPYFGLMCAQYCADDVGAHHVCDSSGKKVCLPGWTGKECTIATEDVNSTRIDDATTLSSILISTSKSTFASLPPDYLTATLKPKRDEPRTTLTESSTASSFSAFTATRPFVKASTATFPVHTVDGLAFPTHPIPRTSTTSTARITDDRISTVLATSSTITRNDISRCYTVLKIWYDDSADSSLLAVLVVMIVVTSLAIVGLMLKKFIRSSYIQNLFNNCWAKISSAVHIQPLKRNRVADKTSKMFTVDLKKLGETLAVLNSSELDHRYSLQPTGEPAKSGKQLIANDNSVLQSNTYHEIDSFLVSPNTNSQLETLV
ncbi:hypothetical protein KIN20_004494 [Parelaphostrongylus tenuis]|uniref:Delta-like protein n=1 Tax=Parelaphostrongylus tenuis TaxID=148309 RepID=A0AAD5M369_PARTN|nr:hypothetical protein KIN20_004494 [Parelaphostrongylus tenuis]